MKPSTQLTMQRVPFWELIPYDLLMLISIGMGVVARLCDSQKRLLGQAVKQLFYSLCIGAGFTAIFVGLTTFNHAVQAGAGLVITFLSTILVEAVQKQVISIGDTQPTLWVGAVWDTFKAELHRYWPLPKTAKSDDEN